MDMTILRFPSFSKKKKLLSFEWVPRFEPPSQNFAAEQVLHPSVNGPDTGIRGKCRMKDSKTYRQYANDCRRIAATMSAKDKTVLLEMARVWDDRAEEAERTEQRREGVT
jgi:hypothetical protein